MSKETIFIFIVFAAFTLDYLIGDPLRLPHPVRIMGRCISLLEKILRKGFKSPERERVGGLFLAVIIILSTFTVAFFLEKWILYSLEGILRVMGLALLTYLTASTIATKELISAGIRINDAVQREDLAMARREAGRIVGRDTDELDEKGVLKAAIESLSENLSDGVIAPLFYLSLGGLPLALAYKAVNTLDSMVGYRNARYIHFGNASARIDDICNFIPARITALLISISAGITDRSFSRMKDSIKTAILDGRKHLSPNSGYPEAAMAGALGISLGGPSTYGGAIVEKPFLGNEINEDCLAASRKAVTIITLSSFIAYLLVLLLLFSF